VNLPRLGEGLSDEKKEKGVKKENSKGGERDTALEGTRGQQKCRDAKDWESFLFRIEGLGTSTQRRGGKSTTKRKKDLMIQERGAGVSQDKQKAAKRRLSKWKKKGLGYAAKKKDKATIRGGGKT